MLGLYLVTCVPFEKLPLPRARQRPGGAAGGGARGIFFKMCLKMDRIFKHLFENGPFSNICLKIDFQTRHWASFSKFHHLIGDASYHTYMLVPRLRWGKNCKFQNSRPDSTIFHNFSGKMNEDSERSWLDASQTDISYFFLQLLWANNSSDSIIL